MCLEKSPTNSGAEFCMKVEVDEEVNAGNMFQVEVTVKLEMPMQEIARFILGTLLGCKL